MKWKTVREGEQAVIFNYLGEGRLIVGPERVYLFRERIQFLTYHTATSLEYLVVTFLTGEIVHIPGPCEMFCNPMEHRRIITEPGITLDGNHLLVVYRKNQKDNAVERRIVQGPIVFIPTAEEWLHKFEWHGESKKEPGLMIPASRNFSKIPSTPDHFQYNIREVRTIDDTMLKVNMMLVYELKDVVVMLGATQDPIADMINAICADIIAFAGKHAFAEFILNTSKLNDMKYFPRLMQIADKIGYEVTNVVYIGYKASDQLQLMQDKAIKSRTQLRLNAELEEQKQKLTDFKLRKEKERAEIKNKMEKDKLEHQQKISKLKQLHEMGLKEKTQEVELQIEDIQNKFKLECDKDEADYQAEYLQKLKELNVDLTTYLVNKNGAPIDQEYRICSPQAPDLSQQVILMRAKFAEFILNTSKLNDMKYFPRLMQIADKIGYEVTNVVYIGYKASDQLQLMQDKAIKSRTQLRLNAELEEQKQKLTDFKLRKEKERAEIKNKMEKDKLEHQQKISKLKQLHEMGLKEKTQEVELQIEDIQNKFKLECDKDEADYQAEYLQKLKELNVDLTTYLVNKNGAPIDQEYRICSPQAPDLSQQNKSGETIL